MSKARILAQLASWLTPDSSGNIVHGAPPAQFDSSGKLATTSFVQNMLGNFGGFVPINASRTLLASDCGKVLWPSAGSLTLTVPTPASINAPIGSAFGLFTSSNPITVVPGSGAAVNSVNLGSAASLPLGVGQSLTLMAVTSTTWQVINSTFGLAANADFLASVGAQAGYQKLPSGLLVQWNTVSVNSTSGTPITYPIAFPTGVIVAVASDSGASGYSYGCALSGKTGFTAYARQGATLVTGAVGYYIALGF